MLDATEEAFNELALEPARETWPGAVLSVGLCASPYSGVPETLRALGAIAGIKGVTPHEASGTVAAMANPCRSDAWNCCERPADLAVAMPVEALLLSGVLGYLVLRFAPPAADAARIETEIDREIEQDGDIDAIEAKLRE